MWKLENTNEVKLAWDLNLRGCSEFPIGYLGVWVRLGTWCFWASLMIPSLSRLLSLPLQNFQPIGVLQQGLAWLSFWTVPQKDTQDGCVSYQVMAEVLQVSALLGFDQGSEPKIFMPRVVPGEVFCSILQTTVLSLGLLNFSELQKLQ